ncbi:hypothetical protein RX327_31190 [Bradyrhizobium sp. BEA-2-5]|uniref:hypothetical protein n=1 Tax=Bradyrhizobium sp. BEA-2-5 TaxID=3080015 RepID=UPI00293E49C7|nr:hypothetical protein [Bradyrhizobium sp. BEA-2-5]WOH85439.1 hypothetical protein RX327_31190 [Bradyrhizobium sp. BEA-2-5]
MQRSSDLPWRGRVVEIRLHARRFRCVSAMLESHIHRAVARNGSAESDARPGLAKANWRSASRSAGSRVRVCRAGWPCRPAATRCCG